MINPAHLLIATVLLLSSGGPDPYREQATPFKYWEREMMRPHWLGPEAQAIYSQMEIYWIDKDVWLDEIHGSPSTTCFIFWDWRTYVIKWQDDRWMQLNAAQGCIAHELGHAIDSAAGYPSGTAEFRRAVIFSYYTEYDQYRSTLAYRFPGVLGRSRWSNNWGGYDELYAQLFEAESFEGIPIYLRPFYINWFRYAPRDLLPTFDPMRIQ